MKRPLVKEGTKYLSIVSGSRCGSAGLKMIGRHFLPGEPTVIGIDEVDKRTLRTLVVHADLVVTECAEKPAAAAASKPAAKLPPAVEADADEPDTKPSKARKRSE